MSLHTFFLESQVLAAEGDHTFALRLSPDDLHHLRVLRLCEGEHVAIVDADSDYFECCIESLCGELPLVRICSRARDDGTRAASAFSISLFQGMPKGDKLETAIRQGTEIGVDGFYPFISERSISRPDPARAKRKLARWEGIAKSAAMQSGRTSIPTVSAPLSVKEACLELEAFDAVVLFWEECPMSCTIADALSVGDVAGQVGSAAIERPQRVAVVVGPEGGFSEDEMESLCASVPQARLCTLGETILRTETAAVVGCALVAYQLGGLGGQGGCA